MARNERLFNNKAPDLQKISQELKIKLKNWLAVNIASVKGCSYVEWISDGRKFINLEIRAVDMLGLAICCWLPNLEL